jgi:hypothetical protein
MKANRGVAQVDDNYPSPSGTTYASDTRRERSTGAHNELEDG